MNTTEEPTSVAQVMMCIYRDGKWERTLKSLRDTKYIAISHSWGKPLWQKLPGLEEEVWVSNERAKFIVTRLPSIVGEEYFWMDILCVEQRKKGADIAVAKHIPSIFRNAQRTVVIRDGTGFRDCCSQVVGSFESWFDDRRTTARSRLHDHCRMLHKLKGLREGVLSRLWVLQEILLSDNIQFVRDEEEKSRFGDENNCPESNDIQIQRLEAMAMAWGDYVYGGTSNFPAVHSTFIPTFLNCGFASRPSVAKYTTQEPRGEFGDHTFDMSRDCASRQHGLGPIFQNIVCLHLTSSKLTPFGQVFPDSNQHIVKLCPPPRHKFCIRDGIEDGPLNRVSDDWDRIYIRRLTRTLYGARFVAHTDFAKLSSHIRLNPGSSYQVSVQGALRLSTSEMLRHIHKAIRRSVVVWRVATEGELRALSQDMGKLEKHWEASNAGMNISAALSVLRKIATNRLSDGFQFRVVEELEMEKIGAELVLRLAALISCGLGLSAFGWSIQNLAPILVNFRGKIFLALAPISIVVNQETHRFALAESHRSSLDKTLSLFVLLAWNRSSEVDESFTLCLFPLDVDIHWKDPEELL